MRYMRGQRVRVKCVVKGFMLRVRVRVRLRVRVRVQSTPPRQQQQQKDKPITTKDKTKCVTRQNCVGMVLNKPIKKKENITVGVRVWVWV